MLKVLVQKGIVVVILFTVVAGLNAQTVNPNPWVIQADTISEVTYRNPVLPGFYSDPTICRVGEDYYLITSTFSYFPGLPVFHSKDLIHWEQIGHVVERSDQFPDGLNIFAPTLRYQEGIFYLISTNVADRGNFFMTAKNPSGPWSDPVWIDISGIDPDLFFDDNGRAYVISSTFELSEVDLEIGKTIGKKRKVWNGTGGRYPEAPHIYKKDGFYYLIAAEGGTEEAHSITVARSNSVWGPYIDNPANPIVGHANVAGMGNPIQGVGHGDLVLAHDQTWWMVLHGYRSVAGYPPHHTLGRETCLVPVSWPFGGWPVVNGNGTISADMRVHTLPKQSPKPIPDQVDFSKGPGLEWNFIYPHRPSAYSLGDKEDSWILRGSADRLGEEGSPAFIGRRLTDMKFSAVTRLNFDPRSENEEAGLVLLNNGTHFDIVVSSEKRRRYLQVRLQFGQTTYKSKKVYLKPGEVDLKIESTGPEFVFSFSQKGEPFEILEKADARFISTETVGWFTGVYVGLYATGNGRVSNAEAKYSFFEYSGKD